MLLSSWGACGRLWGSRKPLEQSSALPQGQASRCRILMSRFQASHRLLVSPRSPPTSQVGSPSLCRTLRLGLPISGSNCPFHRLKLCLCTIPFLQCPSQGQRSQSDHFSSFPTLFLVYASYSLRCTEVYLPVST